MARVVLEPAGGKEAKGRSVLYGVFVVLLGSMWWVSTGDRAILQAAFPAGSARIWGATPALNNSNVKKHDKLRPGDIVLFVAWSHKLSRKTIPGKNVPSSCPIGGLYVNGGLSLNGTFVLDRVSGNPKH
jgi:hypothetical protein